MHNPRNKEIANAFVWLQGNKKVKTQSGLARHLGVTRGYLSNILSGREDASEDFCKNFEAAYELKLRDFANPVEIKIDAPMHADPLEFVTARIVRLEMMLEEILNVQAQQLSETFLLTKKKKDQLPAAQIVERAKARVDAKVAKVRAAQGAKQVS